MDFTVTELYKVEKDFESTMKQILKASKIQDPQELTHSELMKMSKDTLANYVENLSKLMISNIDLCKSAAGTVDKLKTEKLISQDTVIENQQKQLESVKKIVDKLKTEKLISQETVIENHQKQLESVKKIVNVLIVTETQLGDKTRSIQDNVDQIRLEITTLTETLQKESSDRQEDLVTISNELSVKLDKLSHEADLISLRTTIANCNDNVYEAEEKLAMMETTAEDSILRLNKLVDHLQIQIDEMNKAAVDREVQNNQPRDTPRDRGDTPRDHGDTPRDHGNTPRDHGNTPRDHGNTPRDTPTQQDDSNNNRFDHKNTETLIPEQL